ATGCLSEVGDHHGHLQAAAVAGHGGVGVHAHVAVAHRRVVDVVAVHDGDAGQAVEDGAVAAEGDAVLATVVVVDALAAGARAVADVVQPGEIADLVVVPV